MESAKKILPYVLIAIVFAVGGYFIGKGSMSNQEAAFFKSATVAQKASWNCIRNPQGPGCDQVAQIGGTKVESTGPTDPNPNGPLFKTATGTSRPASFRAWLGANGCWEVSGSTWSPVGGEVANGSAEGCLAIKMAPKVNTSK